MFGHEGFVVFCCRAGERTVLPSWGGDIQLTGLLDLFTTLHIYIQHSPRLLCLLAFRMTDYVQIDRM